MFLKILHDSQENTCERVYFLIKVAGLKPATLLKNETVPQVLSSEFCKIFKNPFSIEHLRSAAFVQSWFHHGVSDILWDIAQQNFYSYITYISDDHLVINEVMILSLFSWDIFYNL